jgi:hypothetical protein
MQRATALATTIVLASLVGCGEPEKELPRNAATSSGREKEVEGAPPVPTVSQPEALKFVDQCLAAATEGHPERLDKLKVNRLTESGTMLNEMAYVPTVRKIAAVWPDRFFYSNESTIAGTPLKLAIGLRQGVLSFSRNDEPFDPSFPKSYEQILYVDSIGLHWLPTLVPLRDPKTIVFAAGKQNLGSKSWDTVQAAIPNCPVFTLWFDEKTKLIRAVTYVHMEGLSRLPKQLALTAHKPEAGMMLPTKYEFERNGVGVEAWTVASWEFPDKIDDAVFDQKK